MEYIRRQVHAKPLKRSSGAGGSEATFFPVHRDVEYVLAKLFRLEPDGSKTYLCPACGLALHAIETQSSLTTAICLSCDDEKCGRYQFTASVPSCLPLMYTRRYRGAGAQRNLFWWPKKHTCDVALDARSARKSLKQGGSDEDDQVLQRKNLLMAKLGKKEVESPHDDDKGRRRRVKVAEQPSRMKIMIQILTGKNSFASPPYLGDICAMCIQHATRMDPDRNEFVPPVALSSTDAFQPFTSPIGSHFANPWCLSDSVKYIDEIKRLSATIGCFTNTPEQLQLCLITLFCDAQSDELVLAQKQGTGKEAAGKTFREYILQDAGEAGQLAVCLLVRELALQETGSFSVWLPDEFEPWKEYIQMPHGKPTSITPWSRFSAKDRELTWKKATTDKDPVATFYDIYTRDDETLYANVCEKTDRERDPKLRLEFARKQLVEFGVLVETQFHWLTDFDENHVWRQPECFPIAGDKVPTFGKKDLGCYDTADVPEDWLEDVQIEPTTVNDDNDDDDDEGVVNVENDDEDHVDSVHVDTADAVSTRDVVNQDTNVTIVGAEEEVDDDDDEEDDKKRRNRKRIRAHPPPAPKRRK